MGIVSDTQGTTDVCNSCSFANTSLCLNCSGNYSDRYTVGKINYCPFCGYGYIIERGDGSGFCPKCNIGFTIRAARSVPDYTDEVRYEVPGNSFYYLFALLYSGFHSLLLRGGALNSRGLSAIASCAESGRSFVTFASGRNCFMENQL